MRHMSTDKPPLNELMAAAQDGDKAAYRELLRHISGMLRGYVSKRLSDKNSVEDVVQETLMAVHKARHTYHSDRPFEPWMFAIAHFKLQDHLRGYYKHGKNNESFEDYHASAESADENVTFSDLTGESLDDALAVLNEKQRNIIIKTRVEGYTNKEVAEQLNMTETAVKVAGHRALKKLQKRYKKIA